MNASELKGHLRWACKCLCDESSREGEIALIEVDNVPVKGIMAELTPYLSGVVSDYEAIIIKI
jgi:hypothetical protein